METTRIRLDKLEDGELPPKMLEKVKNLTIEALDSQASGETELKLNDIEKLMEEKAKEHREEMEDRTRRSTNLIIFGLDEPSTKDKEERKQE